MKIDVTPAPPKQFAFEAHVGLSFWDKYGEGANPLDVRENKDPLALVNMFKLFAPEFLEFGITFVGLVDGEIVALAGTTNIQALSVGIQYVVVGNLYRDKKYSSKLCNSMFTYLAEKGVKKVECSDYSTLGHERLRHVLRREALSNKIRLIDKDLIKE